MARVSLLITRRIKFGYRQSLPESMHLVLKKGEAQQPEDLNGMKVGVAAAGSGTQVSVRMILAITASKPMSMS